MTEVSLFCLKKGTSFMDEGGPSLRKGFVR